MPNAVVFGASGLVGGHCLEALLAARRYERVVVVVRRPLGRSHDKLVQWTADFDHLEESAGGAFDTLIASGGEIHAFGCLGTTIKTAGSEERFRVVDHDYMVDAARLARNKGARRFALVSAVGASQSGTFYLRVKAETEKDVAAVSPAWETLEIFRPSLLLGHRAELRIGERIGMALSAPVAALMLGPLDPYRPIQARDVGRAMVASMLAGEPGTHTRYHRDIVRLSKALETELR